MTHDHKESPPPADHRLSHARRAMPVSRRSVLLLGAVGALSLAAGPAFAGPVYPSKPIRMIVPFPPGGATDVVARLLAKSMADNLGQPIIIDNRAGAGAIIGAEAAVKADPDGYTLLYTTAGVHVVNPAIYNKLPYDPLKSWSMICTLVSAPLALTVRTASPFKTAADLIAYAKAHPGKLSYASAGNGTSLHQSGEMFKHATGTNILHVPYKGAGPAMSDFLGGQVDMMFSYIGSVQPGVKAGKLRLLAVGSPKRLSILPDVPTVGELTGRTDYDADTWTGLVAPAGLPAAIAERLRQAAMFAIQEHRDYLMANGYVVLGESPQQMSERVERQLKTLTPLLSKLMSAS